MLLHFRHWHWHRGHESDWRDVEDEEDIDKCQLELWEMLNLWNDLVTFWMSLIAILRQQHWQWGSNSDWRSAQDKRDHDNCWHAMWEMFYWNFCSRNECSVVVIKPILLALRVRKRFAKRSRRTKRWRLSICVVREMFTIAIFFDFFAFILDNDMGEKGAKAICEMLKTNKTVSTVNLSSEKCYLFIYETIWF